MKNAPPLQYNLPRFYLPASSVLYLLSTVGNMYHGAEAKFIVSDQGDVFHTSTMTLYDILTILLPWFYT